MGRHWGYCSVAPTRKSPSGLSVAGAPCTIPKPGSAGTYITVFMNSSTWMPSKEINCLSLIIVRPHSKSLSSGRFQVFRHRRTSLWLAGVGFQAADAADEQVLSGHRRGLLHNTHICRCLEAYSSRGAFFSELQSGRIQAACSSSSRRRFFISMMRQQL